MPKLQLILNGLFTALENKHKKALEILPSQTVKWHSFKKVKFTYITKNTKEKRTVTKDA